MTENPDIPRKRILGRPPGVDGEESREALLKIAIDHLSRYGYSQTTISKIAEEAGVTSGAVYYYFPSKIALVEAAFEASRTRVMQRLTESAIGHTSFRDRITSLLTQVIENNAKDPRHSSIVVNLRADFSRYSELSHLIEKINTFRDFVRWIVQEAKENGELRPDLTVDSVTDMIWAALRGLIVFATDSSLTEHRDAVTTFGEAVLFGLCCSVDDGPAPAPASIN